ncbi:MAG TPA: S9 family peptidase, partial [Planctomycetota bacterium]
MRIRPALVPALLVPLTLAVACQAPNAGARTVPRHDAETFFATTAFTGASFSHDGKELLVTGDQSGVFNAYTLILEHGMLVPLTESTTNAVFSLSWFPDDRRILYTSDQGGNELNHLYVREPDGTVHDLTPGEGLKAMFLGWSADERSFFALTNERDPQFFDLYRYHFGPRPVEAAATEEVAPGFERELLFRNPGGFDLSGVSRDGRWVALTKTNTNADSDVFLAAVERPEERRHVTPH